MIHLVTVCFNSNDSSSDSLKKHFINMELKSSGDEVGVLTSCL